MKKTLAAVFTSLALVAAPAFAQNRAPVDPAATAAVKDLLVSMRYRETMNAAMLAMAQGMPQQFKMSAVAAIDADPKLSAADKAKVLEQVEQSLPRVKKTLQQFMTDPVLMDELFAEMVPLYARIFTVAELRQLGAFYQQPLGQKMLATMPALMAESMEIGNRVITPRLGKLMQQIMQDVTNQK